MKKVQEVAAGIGIPEDELEPYGRYKAKVSLGFVDSLKAKKKWQADSRHRHFAHPCGRR